ncbi:MAG: hypothetical protein U9N55_06190 [candidate division Zixibacteria bacterium]|nr:hypothetical protein [candidate division Zixibacteria bacterium]
MTQKNDIIQQIQERLLAEDRVCEVMGMESDQFWNEILTEAERKVLHEDKKQLVDMCVNDPVQKYALESWRLDYMPGNCIPSRLYEAMVEGGAVSVRVGDQDSSVEMSSSMLSELVDGDEKYEMDFGAFCITIEEVQG